MKATHVFTSEHPVRRGHCMMLIVKTPVPINVPKEWPTIDPAYSDTWVVLSLLLPSASWKARRSLSTDSCSCAPRQ